MTSIGVRPSYSAGRAPGSRWVLRPESQATVAPSSAMAPSAAKIRAASMTCSNVRPLTSTRATPDRCSSSSASAGVAVSSRPASCQNEPRGPTMVPSRSV